VSIPPEDNDYYEKRIREELDLIQEDFDSIKKRSGESIRLFLEMLAQKLGTTVDKLLEFFGPFF
jgi:hypothetical protein